MLEFKPISKEAIPGALAKAEKYRMLNEPREAESICRDVLEADPDHQPTLVTLLLALTDQFGGGFAVPIEEPRRLLERLRSEYERAYYAGVIAERWAKVLLVRGTPRYVVRDWLGEAMSFFEQAEGIRPAGNDDAIIRWNTCLRMIRRETQEREPTHPEPGPLEQDSDEEMPEH